MAFGDVVGELFGFSSNKAWTLTGDDSTNIDLEFQGQFVPQNFKEGGGDANLGEASTINKEAPNFQFLNNSGETVTFTSRFYATDSFKNIKQQIETLRGFKKRDPDLKRPPKFLFTYGTEIQLDHASDLTDKEFKEVCAGSPILRTKLDGLRRNSEYLKSVD